MPVLKLYYLGLKKYVAEASLSILNESMDKTEGTKRAVIIAVEDYSTKNKPNIRSVDYARNDAQAFKKLLIDHFQVKEENIELWIDQDALRSTVDSELPYMIKNLAPEDTFFFYYAGHGHYTNGHNYLTLYDSHVGNLAGTTTSFQDSLLHPLSKSSCKKAFLFIDACATHLLKQQEARSVISDMSEKEFKDYVDKSTGHACFFSCSAGEESYPSKKLEHGIWTWHLVEALSGQANKAMDRDKIITAHSLRHYLSKAIPNYITKKTKIRKTQKPYSVVATDGSLKIIEFDEGDDEGKHKALLQTEDYELRRIEQEPFKSFPGYGPNHSVPTRAHSRAEEWAGRLAQAEIKSEVEEVYKLGKQIFRYRKNDCEKDSENGLLATPFFRYSIFATQSGENVANVEISRILELRTDLNKLPKDFDTIFPKRFNELHVPISGEIDFDELTETFEDLEDDGKGSLVDEDDKIIFSPSGSEGVSSITVTEDGITVHFSTSNRSIDDMLQSTQEAFDSISDPIKKLME